ncbi:hypothetical protein BDZ45DRAFT_240023 [Acephala macrosclerotiorum]|nr:hypothetical protein BDZ45DRAFT_240023 [Acephala macrosclerotiorum]
MKANIAAIDQLLEQRNQVPPTPPSTIPDPDPISATLKSSKEKGKPFTVTSIVAILGVVTAALYFGFQYKLTAEANELTLRESCRSHPNNTFLQGQKTCQTARLESDVEITQRSIISLPFHILASELDGRRVNGFLSAWQSLLQLSESLSSRIPCHRFKSAALLLRQRVFEVVICTAILFIRFYAIVALPQLLLPGTAGVFSMSTWLALYYSHTCTLPTHLRSQRTVSQTSRFSRDNNSDLRGGRGN